MSAVSLYLSLNFPVLLQTFTWSRQMNESFKGQRIICEHMSKDLRGVILILTVDRSAKNITHNA